MSSFPGPIYRVVNSRTGETEYIVSMTDAKGQRLELTDREALLAGGEGSDSLVVEKFENPDSAAASRLSIAQTIALGDPPIGGRLPTEWKDALDEMLMDAATLR